MTWEIYADESSSEDGRFESFAVVSGNRDHLAALRSHLDAVAERDSETKFSGLTGDARSLRDAMGFVQRTIEFADTGRLRVDVIIWDKHDRRHDIRGRDDVANFTRMAYHLIQKVCHRHANTDWSFFPDAGAGVDWSELISYLEMTLLAGPRRTRPQTDQLLETPDDRLRFSVVREVDSRNDRLIQVADLFAGMAAFSRCECPGCRDHLECIEGRRAGQEVLRLDLDGTEVGLSRGKQAKYRLVCHTYHCCKRYKLGVSLRTRGFLVTHDPARPINFWLYDPQHGMDKAPTRSS